MQTGNVVWGYLFPFLWDVVHAVGGSDGDVDSVYGFFVDLLSGFWGGIISAALFGPIALWLFAKNLVGDLDNGLAGMRWFVDGVIAPAWGWLTSTVQWLVAAVGDIAGQIEQTATHVVQDAIGGLQNAIAFVQAQLDQLTQYVTSRIADAVTWLTEQLTTLQQFVASLEQQIETWVSAFVNGIIADLTGQIQPLFDFLAWWQNVGAVLLVAFANDPPGFILALLRTRFLSWLEQLIADNW